MREPETYGYVKYTTVKAALEQIEEHYKDDPERLNDVSLTFEFLVGSFFPEIIDNIRTECNKQYTQGFILGLKEGRRLNDN